MGTSVATVAWAPDPTISVDATTELRWFFDGALPAEVFSWFTDGGRRGLTEERSDSYRHDDLVDVGVKRRFGTRLELKIRSGVPEPVVVGGALGQLERWQRWSPADRELDLAADTRWVDVEKTVIKRRFDAVVGEVALCEDTRPMSGEGCDAEIVEVSVCGRRAWGLAFAGFGSSELQRGRVLETWNQLMRSADGVADIDFSRASPYSYPEWLIGAVSRGALTHTRP